MLLKLCVVAAWLFRGDIVAADQTELMKNLIAQIETETVSKNCFPNPLPKRFQEWNEEVVIGYARTRKERSIPDGECLWTKHFEGDQFGPSGPGSSIKWTEPLRKLLHNLFQDPVLKIKSFFDSPCGDWVWMQRTNLSSITYIGGDITTMTVEENQRCYSKPNIQFRQIDLTCNTPPDVDLMLTRDLLFHLREPLVKKILHNINKSKVRYFLSTTFLQENSNTFRVGSYADTESKRGQNSSIGYRDLNLFDKPYCLPKPMLKIEEDGDVFGKKRYIAMWKVPFTVGNCSEVQTLGKESWSTY